VVDEAAKPLPAGTMGPRCDSKVPLPAGMPCRPGGADERCREADFNEFPGYYQNLRTRLQGRGRLSFVMGRTEDIINVAGHRLPPVDHGRDTGLRIPTVAECAVACRIKDAIKGEVPCGSGAEGRGVQRHAEIEKGDSGAGARKNSVR